MDLPEEVHTGRHCVLRIASEHLGVVLQKVGDILLHHPDLNMSFGHSLAQVSYHHIARMVADVLGHSPDNPLKAPRLREVPARGADERARPVADEVFFQ